MKAAVLSALPAFALATYGVDISAALDQNTANCFVQQAGVSFGIVRGWCSYGGYDSNVAGSVGALWSAGAAHVDVYMFPCPGQDAASQVNSLVSSLSSDSVQYGMIWFDIETNPSTGCGWSDPATNCAYMQNLVDAATAAGVNYGTYASEYMWSSIMGAGCTVGGDHPLWYAHYDNNPSFGDFTPFGGWSTPAMKQYQGDDTVCGFGVDDNFY